MKVDFEKINENIVKEGLNTDSIAIVYENLTQIEAKEIYLKQGIMGLKYFEKRIFDDEIKTNKGERISLFLREHNGKILARIPKGYETITY